MIKTLFTKYWLTFPLVCLALLIRFTVPVPLFASEREFQLIVNIKNPVESITKSQLAALFLKKAKFWENGEGVIPIDLPQSSPVRSRFSEFVLERPISAVKIYWQQMIFSGREVPPAELASEKAVIQYVSTHATAIGYVSEGKTGSGVKTISIK